MVGSLLGSLLGWSLGWSLGWLLVTSMGAPGCHQGTSAPGASVGVLRDSARPAPGAAGPPVEWMNRVECAKLNDLTN